MSQLDSGMDVTGAMEAPYSPLTKSLIRGQMNPRQQPRQPLYNPAMQLQNAQGRAVAQRPRTPMPQSGPGGAGPMADSLARAKGLAMTDLSDEDKKTFQDAAQDQNIPLAQFHQLLAAHVQNSRYAAAHAQHNFGGQPQGDPNAGTIEISQGSGKDGRQAMSQQSMMNWGDQARQQLGAGESIRQTGQGFQVKGLNAGMPQQAPDQTVSMMQAYKGKVSDDRLTRAENEINAGANPAQVAHQLESEIGQQGKAGAAQTAKESAHQEHLKERQDDQAVRGLRQQQKGLQEHGDDEGAAALQKQIDAIVKPPQQQQTAPQQGLPQPPKAGAKLTPEAIAAISKVAKTRQEGEQMAKQAGWSF